jgi:lipoprotein-anchoring transpeptidase ErfK/SrfK
MRSISIVLLCVASLGCPALPAAAAHRAAHHADRPAAALSPQAIEQAAPNEKSGRGTDPATIKAEILLDRAGFSPGVIDGRGGENFKKALAAFQGANGLDRTGRLDAASWDKLVVGADQPVLTEYVITANDLAGPFVRRQPHRMEEMAKLPHLGYASPREELAERFHVSEDLLQQLNRSADFARVGTRIIVTNVVPMEQRPKATSGNASPKGEGGGRPTAARVEVDKRERAVRAFGRDGELLAYFPASIGSAEKPAPSGSFKVRRVSHDPTYHYDPKFAFKGVKARHPFTIKPGPNNPVGLVWIDLSAPSYGIHGTPNPDAISKTQSHGCVRLTNWDALKLAGMVRRGTPVDFVEASGARRRSDEPQAVARAPTGSSYSREMSRPV